MIYFPIKHELINKPQDSFLKTRSGLTNLLCFLDDIIMWIDRSSSLGVNYLDFQKALDKVFHKRLLVNLMSRGLGDKMVKWIEN